MMCEGLMELAKKIHVYLDRNSAATEKNGAHTLPKFPGSEI